jgi:hypothetical protein
VVHEGLKKETKQRVAIKTIKKRGLIKRDLEAIL